MEREDAHPTPRVVCPDGHELVDAVAVGIAHPKGEVVRDAWKQTPLQFSERAESQVEQHQFVTVRHDQLVGPVEPDVGRQEPVDVLDREQHATVGPIDDAQQPSADLNRGDSRLCAIAVQIGTHDGVRRARRVEAPPRSPHRRRTHRAAW